METMTMETMPHCKTQILSDSIPSVIFAHWVDEFN